MTDQAVADRIPWWEKAWVGSFIHFGLHANASAFHALTCGETIHVRSTGCVAPGILHR